MAGCPNIKVITELSKTLGINPILCRNYYSNFETFYKENIANDLPDIKVENEEERIKNIEKLRNEFNSYVDKIKKEKESITGSPKILIEANKRLNSKFNAVDKRDLLNHISNLFSEVLTELSDLANKNPDEATSQEEKELIASLKGLSRKTLANGYVNLQGKLIGGQKSIFYGIKDSNGNTILKGVKDRLIELLNSQPSNSEAFSILNEALKDDTLKDLYLWSKPLIKNHEGFTIGYSYEYIEDANLDNFSENELDELYVKDEATRESWQEVKDAISAYSSIGKEVRRFLSTLLAYEFDENSNPKWKEAKTSFGTQRYCDPIQTYNYLVEILSGVTDSEDMMKRLAEEGNFNSTTGHYELKTYNPLLEEIFLRLSENPTLKTQLYCDIKKNYQEYTVISFENGRFKLINKNRLRTKDFFNTYVSSVLSGRTKPNILSGKIIKDSQLSELHLTLEKINKIGTSKNISIFNYNRLSKSDLDGTYDLVLKMLKDIGLNPSKSTEEVLQEVYRKKKTIIPLIKSITQFKEMLDKLAGKNYVEALSRVVKEDDDTHKYEAMLQKSLKDIISIVYADRKYKTEKRIFAKDKKGNKTMYYSEVLPGWMGDLFDEIQSIPKRMDGQEAKDRLKATLEARYPKNCLFFYNENGYALNRWLRDLISEGYGDNIDAGENENLDDSSIVYQKSFADTFKYNRFLEFNDKSYENLTGKEQMISMAVNFLTHQQIEGKKVVYISKEKFNELRNNAKKSDSASKEKLEKGIIYNIENTGVAYYVDKNNKIVKTGRTVANYPVFILGDSGCAKYITARRYSKNEIIEEMYNVFQQELALKDISKSVTDAIKNRIDGNTNYEVELYGAKDTNWRKNLQKFQYLKFLNDKTDAQINYYMTAEGKETFKEEVRKQIEKEIKKFKEEIDKFDANKSNMSVKEAFMQSVDRKSQNREADYNALIEDYYYNHKFATIMQVQLMTISPSFYNGSKTLQKRYKEIHAPGSELDIHATWNGKEVARRSDGGKISYSERVLYFKDIAYNGETTDDEFMASVLLTHYDKSFYLSEIQQAIKNGICKTNGYGEGEENENRRKKDLEKYLGDNYSLYSNYKKNSLTDGQGYRSMKSYRKVMIMAGKWTKECEDVYNEIRALRESGNITAEKIQLIASKAVVFMPLKPYMYTHEKIDYFYDHKGNKVSQSMLIPVQHKYSEAILIPELLPEGSKLREMAEYMESNENDIDMICSSKCVKTGEFGACNLNTDMPIKDALDLAYMHELDYSDYRIQTNVPEHIYASNLQGTQQRKLIMANIDLYKKNYGHYFTNILGEGVIPKLFSDENTKVNKMTGSNIIKFYNSLIMSNIMESFMEFYGTVTNTEKLQDLLVHNIANNSREAIDNINAFAITGDTDFLIPLFEGCIEHDATATILSIFKKKVNKQKMLGGSAVQVSAFGITGKENDRDLKYVTDKETGNILYAECEIPFAFAYTDSKGHQVQLKYDDYCDVNGEFLKDENGNLKIEKDFPGMLDLVAYRIPTERDYSMMNLKVVRCSKPTEGGTIKVPAPATTVAGFDFDIDKLYLMRKEFKETKPIFERYNLTDEEKASIFEKISKDFPDKGEWHKEKYDEIFSDTQLWEIFKSIYEDYPNLKSQLEIARGLNKELLNRYFEQTEFADRGAKLLGITPKEYKQYLVASKAEELGYTKEAILIKNGYFTFNNNVSKEEKVKIFKETAKSLGFNLKEQERFTKYNPERLAWENSRIDRNNILLELTRQRLMDPETMDQRTTPGGFAQASTSAKILRELIFNKESYKNSIPSINTLTKTVEGEKWEDPEPDYDITNPMTMIVYNQQNQVAGKLIGIFANQNTNHAFTSLLGRFSLKKSIDFCGHTGMKDLLHRNKSTQERERINVNVAEFLAASVDAVKDPVLNFLNFNTITADCGAFLARLGYSTTEIGILFNQPIIIKLCEYAFNNNTTYDIALQQILAELKNTKNNGDTINLSEVLKEGSLTEEELVNGIINPTSEQTLRVLALFDNIYKTSQDMVKFITNTKFTAANAVSSTWGGMYYQQKKVQKYISDVRSRLEDEKDPYPFDISFSLNGSFDAPLVEADIEYNASPKEFIGKYIERVMNNPLAYEQCMYDMNKLAIKVLNEKYYPYDNDLYKGCRNILHSLTKYGIASEDLINALHAELPVYKFATDNASIFGRNIKNFKGEDITNPRKYFEEEFAEELLAKIKEDDFLNNYPLFKDEMIFDILHIKRTNELGIVTETPVIGMKLIDGYTDRKDIITQLWAGLWNSSNPLYQDIAKKLFLYNFYKIGFGFSPSAFMTLTPTDLKESLEVATIGNNTVNYNDYWKALKNETMSGLNVNDFFRQFIMNHLDENSLLYKCIGTNETYVKDFAYDSKSNTFKDSFIVSPGLNEYSNVTATLTKEVDEKNHIRKVRPLISIYDKSSGKQIYYIFNGTLANEGEVNNFNEIPAGSAFSYVKVEPNDSRLSKVVYNSTSAETIEQSNEESKKIEEENDGFNEPVLSKEDVENLLLGSVLSSLKERKGSLEEHVYNIMLSLTEKNKTFGEILDSYSPEEVNKLIEDVTGKLPCD